MQEIYGMPVTDGGNTCVTARYAPGLRATVCLARQDGFRRIDEASLSLGEPQ
jgi:hypothetical protein